MNTQSQIEADAAWMAEHSLEITEKYAGKWIAVFEGRVIGVGATAVEASDQARTLCPDETFILEAVEPHADLMNDVYECYGYKHSSSTSRPIIFW